MFDAKASLSAPCYAGAMRLEAAPDMAGQNSDIAETTTAAEDRELLRSAAVAAGIIASGYFRRDLKTWTKENASPVSEADIVLDDYLRNTLARRTPGLRLAERGDRRTIPTA